MKYQATSKAVVFYNVHWKILYFVVKNEPNAFGLFGLQIMPTGEITSISSLFVFLSFTKGGSLLYMSL